MYKEKVISSGSVSFILSKMFWRAVFALAMTLKVSPTKLASAMEDAKTKDYANKFTEAMDAIKKKKRETDAMDVENARKDILKTLDKYGVSLEADKAFLKKIND